MRPLPSHRPSGICRASSQWVIVAVTGVERMPFRGQRHLRVARGQRFAADGRIAQHHPRRIGLEERQDVVEILARADSSISIPFRLAVAAASAGIAL